MNFSYFISKRISHADPNSFSSVINRIAVASIAIGVAVMLVALLIMGGFRHNIYKKIFSFGAHIQVSKYTLTDNYENPAISTLTGVYQNTDSFPELEHVQAFAYKAGLIRANEEVQGIVFKGMDTRFDTTRFAENMEEGRMFRRADSIKTDPLQPSGEKVGQKYSNEVVISNRLADMLRLKVGDEMLVFFMQTPPRARKLDIVGIYKTGLQDFDEKIVLGDLNLVRRINNWADTTAGGFEVYVNDYTQSVQIAENLTKKLPYELYAQPVQKRYVQMFDWLSLINQNVYIFLGFILFIACFNMVSILFILIMERTRMIGILKSLGASNFQIRKIFIYNGLRLVTKGLIIGNMIGMGFGFIQDKLKVIPLNPENYYMEHVPILWEWPYLILVNLVTVLLVGATLYLPSLLVMRIQPLKAIRFD